MCTSTGEGESPSSPHGLTILRVDEGPLVHVVEPVAVVRQVVEVKPRGIAVSKPGKGSHQVNLRNYGWMGWIP
jgi:hypothetical protein